MSEKPTLITGNVLTYDSSFGIHLPGGESERPTY